MCSKAQKMHKKCDKNVCLCMFMSVWMHIIYTKMWYVLNECCYVFECVNLGLKQVSTREKWVRCVNIFANVKWFDLNVLDCCWLHQQRRELIFLCAYICSSSSALAHIMLFIKCGAATRTLEGLGVSGGTDNTKNFSYTYKEYAYKPNLR